MRDIGAFFYCVNFYLTINMNLGLVDKITKQSAEFVFQFFKKLTAINLFPLVNRFIAFFIVLISPS